MVMSGYDLDSVDNAVSFPWQSSRRNNAVGVQSNCHHAEVSDSQPLVSELNTAEKPQAHLVSCEIKPVGLDDDNGNTDANEETHLVSEDVSQCRICLDNGGLHHDLYCFLMVLKGLDISCYLSFFFHTHCK
jgi:hypothetical protein